MTLEEFKRLKQRDDFFESVKGFRLVFTRNGFGHISIPEDIHKELMELFNKKADQHYNDINNLDDF